jgi:hypothetical protein
LKAKEFSHSWSIFQLGTLDATNMIPMATLPAVTFNVAVDIEDTITTAVRDLVLDRGLVVRMPDIQRSTHFNDPMLDSHFPTVEEVIEAWRVSLRVIKVNNIRWCYIGFHQIAR